MRRGSSNGFARNGSARASFDAVQERWRRLLGAISVRSPDPTFDVLANGWLLYQVISCRLWARSGFYQSGGAFGFRDQLQDAMALVHADARCCASRSCSARRASSSKATCSTGGIRRPGEACARRCSDDFLWLPLATARYVEATGDDGILRRAHRLSRRAPAESGRGVVLRHAAALAAAGRSLRALPARDRARIALPARTDCR